MPKITISKEDFDAAFSAVGSTSSKLYFDLTAKLFGVDKRVMYEEKLKEAKRDIFICEQALKQLSEVEGV